MNRHTSLRASLLAAIGAAGCSSPQGPTGDPAAVVDIPAPSATTTTATATPDETAAPEPTRPPSNVSGWVEDKDGTVHRAAVTRCDAKIDRPVCKGTESHLSCKTDADCNAHPHGKCVTGIGQVGSYCGCLYSCATDSDCGPDRACVCKGTGNLGSTFSVCADAECHTDSDCAEGECGLSVFHDGCSEDVALVCRSRKDACHTNADCRQGGFRAAACAASPPAQPGAGRRWECQSRSCVVGRPLVVDGAPRAAAPARRADWSEYKLFEMAALGEPEREGAAAHWAAQAALEHASIASFARFSLQLLALGAPADLVAEAHRAALDEVEHARIAYGVASRLAGREVGPGSLPEAAAPLRLDVAAVVEALVEEGCVGETLGAAEGRSIARRVSDAALAGACQKIAADEERHAALAWRTLAWMLSVHGPEARAAADRAFGRALEQLAVDPEAGPVVCEEVGVLAARTLGALRREVADEVIRPCREQLARRD